MRLRILLLFLFLGYLNARAGSALYIPVQFVIENGNYDGSLVVLKKNGETVFSLPGEKNMRLKLEYNEAYLIAFSKPGYITKQIAVDTHVPDERIRDVVDPYKIGVRLYKQYEGVNIVVYNQPVAAIKYLASLDDMGYDTDYTKSILSLLTDTENKLAAKAEEERAHNKSGIGSSENKSRKELDEQPDKSTSKSVLKENPIVQNTGVSERVQTDPLNSSENNVTAESDNPQLKNSKLPPNGYGEDNLNTIGYGSGIDEKETGSMGYGKDHKKQSADFGSGQDYKGKENNSNYTTTTTIDQIHEQHRTITTVLVEKNGKTTRYHKVQYLNGECYYFMNGASAISSHLFEYFTGIKN
jgi:hypothetical protein